MIETETKKSAKARGLRKLEQWGEDQKCRQKLGIPYDRNPPRPPNSGSYPAGKDRFGGDQGYLRGSRPSRPADDPEEAAFRHCQVEAAFAEAARRACVDVDQLVREAYEHRVQRCLRNLALWVFRDGKAPAAFPDTIILMNEARLYGADEPWLREFVRHRIDVLAAMIGTMELDAEAVRD